MEKLPFTQRSLGADVSGNVGKTAVARKTASHLRPAPSRTRRRVPLSSRLQSLRAGRRILDQAKCLIWHASVSEVVCDKLNFWGEDHYRPIDLRWDVEVINTAQSSVPAWLPLERLPHETFTAAWVRSRCDEDRLIADLTAREALRTGKTQYTQVLRHTMADGTDRYLSEDVRIEPLTPTHRSAPVALGPDGQPLRQWQLTGVVTDVTEKCLAQKDREAVQTQLYQVLSQANCLLWWADVEETSVASEDDPAFDAVRGTGIRWQPVHVINEDEAFRWMKIAHEPGEPFFAAWNRARHPDDFAECNRRSQDAFASDADRYTQIFRTYQQDGTVQWLQEDVRIEAQEPGLKRSVTGQPLRRWRVTGVVTNVTERKIAEIAVAEAQQSLQQAMGQANCLLWQADVFEVFPRDHPHMAFDDRRGTHLYWSLLIVNHEDMSTPSWLPRFQLPGEDIHGALFRARLPVEMTVVDVARDALYCGDSRYTQAFRLKMTDGTICWMAEDVRIKELPPTQPDDDTVDEEFRSIDGKPLRRWQLTGVITDINERKQVEEQQEALMAQLRRSIASLQEFAYVASHDLKEPLRKIQSLGNLLRRKAKTDLDPEANQYIDRMMGAANRLQALIQALLEYSLVAGKVPEWRPVDLNDIAAATLRRFQERISAQATTVEIGTLPIIQADREQMGHLFEQLFSNALRFQRPGVPGVVRVHAQVQGETVILQFADNGIGFESRHAERIFQIFERLAGRGDAEGCGVGLAMCRKIVEQHGGTIFAEGSPGNGAVITVRLPRLLPSLPLSART